MQELQKINPNPTVATPAMCTLLALNTASITLVPTTIIAIRMNFGSVHPAEIVAPTLLATLVSTGAAILADRWYRSKNKTPPTKTSILHREGAAPPASTSKPAAPIGGG
jgi:spore maturation protein A